MLRALLTPVFPIVLMGVLSAGFARADAVVWDYSPVTTGAGQNNGYTNTLAGQSFAEAVSFAKAVQITGMDIYCWKGAGVVAGNSATIRLWNDVSGKPGVLLTTIAQLVSAVDDEGAGSDNRRAHVDFASPLYLASDTSYWIGMAGTTKDFTQTGLLSPGDSKMAQFSGSLGFIGFTAAYPPYFGDMAFRLEGTFSPLPAAAWTGLVLLSALGGFRLTRR